MVEQTAGKPAAAEGLESQPDEVWGDHQVVNITPIVRLDRMLKDGADIFLWVCVGTAVATLGLIVLAMLSQ